MSRVARPSGVRLAVGALVLLAGAGGLAACGGEEDVSRTTFQSELRERTTIPSAVAECITDKVFDEYDQGEINEIYRAPEVRNLPAGAGDDLAKINQDCFEQETGGGSG